MNRQVHEIMTEQVNTKIENKYYYNMSTIQYEHCIYYFKRIYDEEDSQSSVRSGVSASKRSGGSDEDLTSTSYLQLFKFDLLKYKEDRMEGYQLVEYNDDDRTFNIIFS